MAQVSRRFFNRSLVAGAAALQSWNESALAQMSMIGPLPPGAIKLNSNENPLGPCSEAREAMRTALEDGGRYQFEQAGVLEATLAEVEGVPASHVRAFAGSSDPLHRAVLSFTSKTRSFVAGDPGYEAGDRAAEVTGAVIVRVPLSKTYAHDVGAMARVAPSAGLFYIANPNNPTGTITPRADIEWLLANKPAGSIVLLDEAYLHISKTGQPCTDLAAKGRDIIVLRTFSKLYGMAGLRAGAAIARPDLLAKLDELGIGIMPSTGAVGAIASLKVKNLVAQRRGIISEARDETLEWLDKRGVRFVPSDSNKFMVDVKRPGREVIRLLAAEKVFVGRVWPSWPNHIRVTVGTRDEMAIFRRAFANAILG